VQAGCGRSKPPFGPGCRKTPQNLDKTPSQGIN
jgi:hypothetical protein